MAANGRAKRIDAAQVRGARCRLEFCRCQPGAVYPAQRELGGRSQQFTIIGYDVFGGLGGPGLIVRGRVIRAAHDEAVLDRKLGVEVGETVVFGTRRFTVVGLTQGAVDAAGNPLVYLSLADAQQAQFQQDPRALVAAREAGRQRLQRAGYQDEQAARLLPLLAPAADSVNTVLVKLAPGADAAVVAQHMRTWLHFNVYTSGEERALMLEGRLSRMSAVLGLFQTIEKIRAIATLKLIGAPNLVIVRMILEQSLALTLGSFVLAYGLRALAAPGFPRTLAFLSHETAATFAVMLAGGVLASSLAIWHALRTPPQMALGG